MRRAPASVIGVLVVSLAWAQLVVAQCNSCDGDLNGDEQVTIDELIKAVNNALQGCTYNPTIDPGNFVASVTNPYLSWVPGTVFHYRSAAHEDITVNVSSDTKVILGVSCTVVHDVVSEGGEITEDTFDWYAQDRAGNVWYFGEDTKAFDNGHVSTEGSWEAGVNGAKPGIVMKASPRVGDKYRQEYAPGAALDRAEVIGLDASVNVIAGSYLHCLETKETTDLDPTDIESKFYCPNIGEVLTTTTQGEREELTAIEVP